MNMSQNASVDSVELLVAGARADPASLAAVAGQLLERLSNREDATSETWSEARHLGRFLESATRALLEWVATGGETQVRDLREGIEAAIERSGADRFAFERMPPKQQLNVGLHYLLLATSAYLRTDGTALQIGRLSGPRHASWRRLLQFVDEGDGVTTVRKLTDAGLFTQRTTADNALNALTAMRLLDKYGEAQPHVFRLTLVGRRVSRELRKLLGDERLPHPDRAPSHGVARKTEQQAIGGGSPGKPKRLRRLAREAAKHKQAVGKALASYDKLAPLGSAKVKGGLDQAVAIFAGARKVGSR